MMETKSGIKIPIALSSHLQKSKSLKEAWDKLRPSCQRDFVEQINKAKTEEVLKTKLDRVIHLTLEYAQKHPDKYKKNERQKQNYER